MSAFTFYDYVNDDANNLIHAEIPNGARAKLNRRIEHLEVLTPGQWTRPLVDTLTGECAGLFEVRAPLNGVQYRILSAHVAHEREPVLLFGFKKKGAEVPPKHCEEALRRKAKVSANPSKHREVHRL